MIWEGQIGCRVSWMLSPVIHIEIVSHPCEYEKDCTIFLSCVYLLVCLGMYFYLLIVYNLWSYLSVCLASIYMYIFQSYKNALAYTSLCYFKPLNFGAL